MRTQKEIMGLLISSTKEIEQKLNVKIRNGQQLKGIKIALAWVCEE